MARALLVSKLVAPPLPRRVVPRERVRQGFAGAAEARLTLVAALPGAGKTVAVREWVESLGDGGGAVAWLTLDEDDNEPSIFWSYVVGALQRVDPAVGVESAALLDEGGAHRQQFLVALLNDLDACGRRPVFLVLDDLHKIRDPRVLEELEVFIDRLPPGVHVVATSRVDPGLPLGRWRARGELLEVRGDVLQFRPDEAAAFLDRFAGLELDEHAVALVAARTEGWAVGLQLAALSLQGREDAAEFMARFAGDDRIVADFLVGEVVDHQPPEITEFLLETSVLRRLTAPACDAVTRRTDSARLLRELEARYLFVTEVEPGGRAFRYHDLFAELLRHLLQSRRPGAFEELNRRAAEWYEAQGNRVDAVHHWVGAGDNDRAFSLVTLAMLLAPSHYSPALEGRTEWLDLIPPDYIAADPGRMVECAFVLTYMARYADAERWIRGAEQRIVDTKQAAWARLLLARGSWLGVQGDLDGAVADLNAAVELFGVLAGPESVDPYATRAAPMLARAQYMLGDPELAEQVLRELSSQPDLDPFARTLIVPAIESVCAMAKGELERADVLSARAIGTATHLSLLLNYAATEARLVQLELLVERGELARADAELETFIDDCGVEQFLPLQVLGWILNARVVAARSGPVDALEPLAVARHSVAAHAQGDGFTPLLDRAEVRQLVDAGNFEPARLLITRLPDDEQRRILEVRLDIALDRAASARGRLATIDPVTLRRQLEVELLRVRAEAPVRTDVALEHLRRAVELGRADGYFQTYLDAGADVARLLRVLADREPSPFLATLVSAGDHDTPVDTAGVLVEALTDREWSVLRLLTGTLTNREISDELYMSLNTLKTHLKSIYRKLQVTSRHDAVAAARRRGIL